MTGLFVPIEGIDGCGKTTIAREVVKVLLAQGITARYVSRKQKTSYGNEYLNRFMRGLHASLWNARPEDPVGDVPESVWLCLHSAWYHMMADKVIGPSVRAGEIIVTDGWYYKFLARHIVHGDGDLNFTRQLLANLVSGDIVVLLDILPEAAWERRGVFRASELGAHARPAAGPGPPQKHFIDYQAAVRAQYLEMGHADNWWQISNNGPVEAIVDRVAREIVSRINLAAEAPWNGKES